MRIGRWLEVRQPRPGAWTGWTRGVVLGQPKAATSSILVTWICVTRLAMASNVARMLDADCCSMAAAYCTPDAESPWEALRRGEWVCFYFFKSIKVPHV